MQKEKKFVSAVIYIRNCDDCIEQRLDFFSDLLDDYFENYEVICVNDASSDNSLEKIKAYAKTSKATILLVNMSVFHGKELSMSAGIDASIGDFVFEFDNIQYSFPKQTVKQMYEESTKGYDIVLSAPKNRQGFLSNLYYSTYNKYSKSQYRITNDAFRMLSRRAVNRVQSLARVLRHRKAIYSSSGLKITHITYESKKNYSNKIDVYRRNKAIDSIILFTDLAQRISIGLSVTLLLLTFFLIIYTVAVYFSPIRQVEGWTSMMLVLSGSFTGLFLILTIIVKYLTLIIEIIFEQKEYLVESMEKLG